jgi:hypothetical protein
MIGRMISLALALLGARPNGETEQRLYGWNRLNIAARTVPGDYVPGSLAKVHAAR